jgi:hypothetical protein
MAPDNRLSTAEIDKLCAILALLTSDKAGEACAAAAAATRFLAARGLTWRDLLVPALSQPEAAARSEVFDNWPRHWRAAVDACRQAPVALSDWDRRFLTTVAGYEHRPSDRQLDILATIVGNVLAAGGAP